MIVIFWLICIFLHKKLSEITYTNGLSLELEKTQPLYDVIQRNTPNLQTYRLIPEILHLIPIVYLIYLILRNREMKALKVFLKCHGVLMLFRAMCFSLTLLPDSSQMCQVSNHFGSCFDLIFSGHSTIMLLCTLIIRNYFKVGNTVYLLLQINNLITSILIIMCRNHYSVDVLISLLLTTYVYQFHKN